jgi:hypothetical protein
LVWYLSVVNVLALGIVVSDQQHPARPVAGAGVREAQAL